MSQRVNPSHTHRAAPLRGAPAIYTHPDEVLSDPKLAPAEKKALLASWISDARAVENAPTLRQLECGAVIEVDVLRRALLSLDERTSDHMDDARRPPRLGRRRSLLARWARRGGRTAARTTTTIRRRLRRGSEFRFDRRLPTPLRIVRLGKSRSPEIGVWRRRQAERHRPAESVGRRVSAGPSFRASACLSQWTKWPRLNSNSLRRSSKPLFVPGTPASPSCGVRRSP
jgi:hypothetical protein